MVGAAVVATSLVAVRGQTAGQASRSRGQRRHRRYGHRPAAGPEAGVWVIAETTSPPTRLIRIVVTDDRGRFVIPDLPKAPLAQRLGSRLRAGGLAEDHCPARRKPGAEGVAAPPTSARRRATTRRSDWYAMMQMPPKSDFPGTGETGNGISPNIRSQGEWIRNVVNTDGCTGCHQMGGAATRTIPPGIMDARHATPRPPGTGASRLGRLAEA